jgi:hypothetical protein
MYLMFRILYQSGFQPPQHGNGMWPPLAYALDGLGIFVAGSIIFGLLILAWAIVPLMFH